MMHAAFQNRQHSIIRTLMQSFCVLALMIFAVIVLPRAFAAEGIYRPINYQGKLTNTGGVAIDDGRYDMRFKIFSTLTGGVALWTESWNSSTEQATATGGLFSLALGTHVTMTGSVNFNSDSLYLQVEFDPGEDGTFEEVFSPRRRFASVPYAHNANTLDGLTSSQFLRSDTDTTASGTITVRQTTATKLGIDIIGVGGTNSGSALRLSTQGAAHILFGTGSGNYDTTLYRSDIATLKTDGSFHVLGTLSGTSVHATNTLTSSGTLTIVGATRIDGNTFTVDAVNSSVGIGTATPETILEIIGTASGTNLHGEASLSSSGTLVFEGAGSGSSLYIATSLTGVGLEDCDSVATQKLLWNSATGRFSCGSDQGGAGTVGMTIANGDERYVNTSGDTMTGALTINLSEGYLGLNILQMLSGAMIHAEQSLTSSGTLKVVGASTFSTIAAGGIDAPAYNIISASVSASHAEVTDSNDLFIEGALEVDGATFLDGALTVGGAAIFSSTINLGGIEYTFPSTESNSGNVLATNGAGQLTWKTLDLLTSGSVIAVGDPRYVNTSGDTMTGALVIDLIDGGGFIGLNVVETISGAFIHAEKGLSSSGTLNVLGASLLSGALTVNANATFGSTVTLNGIAYTFPGAENNSGNVLVTNGAGNLSWKTLDLLTSGSVIAVSDPRYVNIGGDTMTGALTISLSSGYLGLNILQMLSGSMIHAEQSLTSSGTLKVVGASTFSTIAAGGTGANLYNIISSSIGKSHTEVADSNDLFIEGALEVDGATFFDSTLTVSGSAIFLSTVTLNGIAYTFPSTESNSGNVLATNGAGQLTWKTLDLLTSGSVIAVSDPRYVNIGGDTMTGALVIDLIDGGGYLGLNVIETISGSIIHAEKDLSSSGTLVVAGTGSFKSGVSGTVIHIMAGDSYILGNLAIGKDVPSADLDVAGTLSGTNIIIANAATFSGTLMVVNTASFRGAISGVTLNISGNISASGSILVNDDITVRRTISGATLTIQGDASMTILAAGGISPQDYNAFADLGGSATHDAISSDDDLFIEGSLEVDGSTFLDGALAVVSTITASGALTVDGLATLRDSLAVTSNITASGALTVDGLTAIRNNLTVTGNVSASGTLAVESGAFIRGTLSGNIIHTETALTSSGTLSVEGASTFSVIAVGGISPQAYNAISSGVIEKDKFLIDSTNDLFIEGDLEVDGVTYLDGSLAVTGGATFSSTVTFNSVTYTFPSADGSASGVLTTNGAGQLVWRPVSEAMDGGTLSGNIIHAETILNSSGTLVVDGLTTLRNSLNVTSNITASGTLAVDGLTTLRGNLDVVGNIAASGALSIESNAFISGTLSGNIIHAETALTSSGTFAVQGLSYFRGTLSGNILHGSAFTSSGTLVVDGLTTLRGNLDVVGNIAASGSLSIESNAFISGTLSGNIIHAETSFTGAGLEDCNTEGTQKLMWDSSTGRFSCGSDQGGGGSGLSQATADARYVNQSGDTMTGALTINLTSGYLGLNVLQMLSGSVIHAEQRLTSSGTLKVLGAVTFASTLSGDVIHAEKGITSSGTLVFEGAASGSTLYVATSINGAGLADCNVEGTQKLMWDSDTGRFACGTDYSVAAFGTGQVITTGDARYVNQSGDTMTGTLTINLSSGTIGLNVLQTISGATIHAEQILTSSGTLAVQGLTTLRGNLDVVGNIAASGSLSIESNAFISGTLSGNIIHAETLLNSSGALVVDGLTTLRNSLNVTNAITASGTLSVEGNAQFKSSMTINGVTYNFPGADGAASGRVLATDGNGNLSWTEVSSGGSGLSQSDADSRYVNQSGDTMTGALTIDVTGGDINTIGLKVINALSGAMIHAEKGLTSSGTLAVEGNAYLRGTTSGNVIHAETALTSSGTLAVEGLSYFRGTLSGNILHGAAFTSSGTLAVDGLTTLRGNLDVVGNISASGALSIENNAFISGTLSGNIIHAETILNSSGALVVDGLTTLRNSLNVTNAITASGTLAVDGLTMLRNSLNVTSNITASGTLAVEGNAYLRGTTSGNVIHTETALTSSGTLSVDGLTILRSSLNVVSAITGSGTLTIESGALIRGNTFLSGSLAVSLTGSFSRGITASTLTGSMYAISSSGGIFIDVEDALSTRDVFKIVSDVAGDEDTAFRITASGAVYSDATYNSAGADYAEWFYSAMSPDLQPGELVCIDTLHDNAVQRCTRESDPNLMGIVSTHPAFIGNVINGADGLKAPGYILVGLIGQVPAHVSTVNGPIRPGDALTSSDIPGVARRANAGDSTVGVALEGYDGTEQGTVNVLISRRNSSMTVDAVGQKVLDTIAAMKIDDEVQLMVQQSASKIDFKREVSAVIDEQIASLNLASQVNDLLDARLGSGSTVSREIMSTVIEEVLSFLRTTTGAVISEASVAATVESRLGIVRGSGTILLPNFIAEESSLSELTVFSGATIGGMLRTVSLDVQSGAVISGGLIVNGPLTAGSGFTIGSLNFSGSVVGIGSLTATGSLHVLGKITISELAVFLGPVQVQGELILSNRQAGYAQIPLFGTSVTIRFEPPMSAQPIVTASPDVPVLYAVSRATTGSVTIRLAGPAQEAVMFSYVALTTLDPTVTTGSVHASGPIPFYVDSKRRPFSENDPIWTACIQKTVLLSPDGSPYNCSRYHDANVWEHPDLRIPFTYNDTVDPAIILLPDGYQIVIAEQTTDVEPEVEEVTVTTEPEITVTDQSSLEIVPSASGAISVDSVLQDASGAVLLDTTTQIESSGSMLLDTTIQTEEALPTTPAEEVPVTAVPVPDNAEQPTIIQLDETGTVNVNTAVPSTTDTPSDAPTAETSTESVITPSEVQ